jgi:hypothetical protein
LSPTTQHACTSHQLQQRNLLNHSNQSHAILTTTSHTMSGSEPIKGGKSYAPAP